MSDTFMVSKPMSYTDAKIAFVHGRPGPHATHAALANAVGAEFFFVDRLVRYHDMEDASKLRSYASSLINGIFFQNARKFDLILSEGMHLPPVVMRKLGIIGAKQRIAAVMGNELLFFLKTKWFSPKTTKLLTYAICQYDALICMSEFQTELAVSALEGQRKLPKIITAHEIISGGRPKPTEGETSNRDGHKLLFVAHGPSGWRGYYKGLETLLQTFKMVEAKFSDAELTVIGDWDEGYVREHREKTHTIDSNINFIGRQKDLPSYFDNADLCVHITNGDAFPIATLEAIRAGLPTIVSDLTGTKEVVAKVDPRMVVPMNAEAAFETIDWYFGLSDDEKKQLSDKGREVMLEYSEDKGLAEFRNAVDQVLAGS